MADEDAFAQAGLVRCFGCDTGTAIMVRDTVAQLPQEPRQFVIDHCVFFSVGPGYGQTMPARFLERAKWFVVIDDRAPDIRTVIAHEIAHCFLRHDVEDMTTRPELDREARALTRSWGFTGVGADRAD